MTREEFWSLVEQAKGDETALESALVKIPPDAIESFQSHFNELHAQAQRWDLWGVAYPIEGGCSDDGFIDVRYGALCRARRGTMGLRR